MKILSRDFSVAERVLLVFLGLVLVGLTYYRFVDQPVRTALRTAQSEQESLQAELDTVNTQIAHLSQMQNELTDLKEGETVSKMPSYNNSKAELALLNDALRAATKYVVTFSDVTRDGDQIRRGFTLQFTAPSYDAMKQIFLDLAKSPYRCLIGDITCSAGSREGATELNVSATATFYETMVGGVPDAGLPADTSNTPEEQVSGFDSAVVGQKGAEAELMY